MTGVLAGTVSDRLSRKYTISLGSAIFAVGSAISAASKTSLGVLILGRCIAGTGEGLFLGCLGVYLCEIAPRHLRSQMLLIQQLICTGGVALGFFVCYGRSLPFVALRTSADFLLTTTGSAKIDGTMAWRFPFVLQTVTATAVAILAPFQPYSARVCPFIFRRFPLSFEMLTSDPPLFISVASLLP